MAISKVIYQDSCEELVRAAAANGEMMCTLIETEAGVKKASSDLVSRELLEKYRPSDSKTACIHLIAMGNSDQYGFNRNGDYFAGDVLEKRAHTFVTNGHMFREHRNKDPKKAIGQVKWAGYDPKGMQRVELIVHMDKDKAEEEYEMAKQGSALNFSMSCRVPNDRCSCCGNEAKSVTAYCDHLKSHMGQYVSGMDKYAFAYNDNPTFFDISRVKTPADRIARHLEYMFQEPQDDLQKAASAMVKAASAEGTGAMIPSAVAAMAEGINLDVLELEEQNMLTKLAASEAFSSAPETYDRIDTDPRAHAMFASYPYALMEKMSSAELAACRAVEPGTLFHELTKRGCMLSFPAFCQYLFDDVDAEQTPLVKSAALMLPGIFGSLVNKMMSVCPCTSLFRPSSEFMAEQDPKRGDLVQNVMDSMENKFSLKQGPVQQRVITIVIKTASVLDRADRLSEFNKSAAATTVNLDSAQQLAEAYGQYQIRTLCDMRESFGDAVDNVYDLVAGANTALIFDNY